MERLKPCEKCGRDVAMISETKCLWNRDTYDPGKREYKAECAACGFYILAISEDGTRAAWNERQRRK